MEETVLAELVSEMREDFQIPPYFSDAQLSMYAKEGYAYLEQLNPGCEPVNDLICRSLLKNYMYYAVHHKVNEYIENYKSAIVTWQLETEVVVDDTTT